MNSVRSALTVLLVITSLTACASLTRLMERRIVGLIPTDHFPDLTVIQVPARARINQPMTVTVLTYGSSSCITPDGATVQVHGSIATIVPYDRVPRSGGCTADLVPHPRAVQLIFETTGLATIRVIGTTFSGESMTVNANIMVMP